MKSFLCISFYPLLQWDYKFENHTFIWICTHILDLIYMTSLEKSLCKIISKSIHVDTANIYLFKASDVVLVFLLLNLNILHTFFSVSFVDFEQVNVSRVVIINNSNSMWCLITFNEIFFFSLEKGDGIACVNYLKVKNDVTHWKVIISDKSQIHVTPNFLLLSSQIVILPATYYCNRLQEAKERISYRSVEIFSFLLVILNDFSLLYYLNFNLWSAILLQVILY